MPEQLGFLIYLKIEALWGPVKEQNPEMFIFPAELLKAARLRKILRKPILTTVRMKNGIKSSLAKLSL